MSETDDSKILFSVVTVLFTACFSSILIPIFDSLSNIYKQPLNDSISTRYLSNKSTTTSLNITNFSLTERNELSNYTTVNTQWSIIVYSLAFGAFFGNLASSYIPFTKKNTLLFNNFVFLVGIVIILSWQHFVALAIAIISIGFGLGIVFSTVPGYLKNFWPDKRRGFHKFFLCFFIFIGSFIGQALSDLFNTKDNWIFGLIIPLIFLSILSPALYFVQEEKKVNQSQTITSIWSLLRNKNARKLNLITIIFEMAKKFGGINLVLFFLPNIFKIDDKDKTFFFHFLLLFHEPVAFSILLQTQHIVKRVLVYVSIGICIISLFFLVFSVQTFKALVMFIYGFDFGVGLIPFFITDEVILNENKAAINFISEIFTWIFAFFIPLILEMIYPKIGSYFFIVFAICLGLGVFYIGFSYRKTWSNLNKLPYENVIDEKETLVLLDNVNIVVIEVYNANKARI